MVKGQNVQKNNRCRIEAVQLEHIWKKKNCVKTGSMPQRRLRF